MIDSAETEDVDEVLGGDVVEIRDTFGLAATQVELDEADDVDPTVGDVE